MTKFMLRLHTSKDMADEPVLIEYEGTNLPIHYELEDTDFGLTVAYQLKRSFRPSPTNPTSATADYTMQGVL